MAVLEIETFTLNPGVDPTEFRALDERMQEWCYLNRPGLARRTTARGSDGEVIVITLFGDQSQAVAVRSDRSDSVVDAWNSAINRSSRDVTVYSLL